MLINRTKTALFASLVTACLGLPGTAQELSARDHKDLAKHISKYLEEDSADERAEIKDDLRKALEKIGKKQVEKGENQLQGALALTDDLGEALRLSTSLKSKRGGSAQDGEIEFNGQPITYKAWIPSGYKHTGDPTPVVLCLPGLGNEGGPMSPDQFLTEHWTEGGARDEAIIAAIAMPEDIDSWGTLDGAGGKPGGVAHVMLVLKDLRDNYAVDADRVYLLGRGPGVAAAVSLGSMFPHIFAGVAGQAGDAGEAGWGNFRNLPTFFQGGGSQATAFAEGVDEEYKNCTLQPDAGPEEIWSWMKDNPRVSNPSKVTLVPGRPIPNKAYWIEIPPIAAEGDISLTAEADRESNRITITSTGVPTVKLYYNDHLVDLDEPITLVLNGVEQKVYVRRSIDDLLGLYTKGTSDPGKLYVAQGSYDLP